MIQCYIEICSDHEPVCTCACCLPILRLEGPKSDILKNSFSYLNSTPVIPLFSELRSRHRLTSQGGIPHSLPSPTPTAPLLSSLALRCRGTPQSSLSLPSSLTQKCERGLLNGPDRRRRRRPRGQQQKAGVDFAATAEGNKSTYCTHSTKKERRKTSRATNHRKGRRKGRKGKERRCRPM